MKQPTSRNQKSVLSAIKDTNSFAQEDRRYIRYTNDLITVAGDKEDSWINGVVEDWLGRISRKFRDVRDTNDTTEAK